MAQSALWTMALALALVARSGLAATPAAGRAGADGLDFWLGEWSVLNQDGTKAGDNRIEKILDGCAILEHWTDADGSTGKSFFYFLPASGRWKQVWVESTGAVIKEKLSETVEDGLRFVGKAMLPDGREIPDRTTLTRIGPDRVRQLIENSRDGGRTWIVSFDAIYVRKA